MRVNNFCLKLKGICICKGNKTEDEDEFYVGEEEKTYITPTEEKYTEEIQVPEIIYETVEEKIIVSETRKRLKNENNFYKKKAQKIVYKKLKNV